MPFTVLVLYLGFTDNYCPICCTRSHQRPHVRLSNRARCLRPSSDAMYAIRLRRLASLIFFIHASSFYDHICVRWLICASCYWRPRSFWGGGGRDAIGCPLWGHRWPKAHNGKFGWETAAAFVIDVFRLTYIVLI